MNNIKELTKTLVSDGAHSTTQHPRTLKGSNKVREIIEATIKCMNDAGPDHVSFQKIAARLNLKPSHVNYYFETKESLIYEAVNYVVLQLQQHIVAKLSESIHNKSSNPLKVYIEAFFDFLTDRSHYQIVFPVNVYLSARNPEHRKFHRLVLKMAGERLLKLIYPTRRFSKKETEIFAFRLQRFVVGVFMDFVAEGGKNSKFFKDHCLKTLPVLVRSPI